MTLAGLRSRCTTPFSCAAASASASATPNSMTRAMGSPPGITWPIKPVALDQLHRQEPHAVLILDRIERDDVRVVEAGDDAGFVFESRQAFRVRGHAGRQYLEGHVTTESVIPGPIHLAHAAGAERRDDVVSTESGAYRDGHRKNLRADSIA